MMHLLYDVSSIYISDSIKCAWEIETPFLSLPSFPSFPFLPSLPFLPFLPSLPFLPPLT